jgi:pilus assembly protein CpaB
MNKNVLIAFGGATLIALVVAVMLNAMLKGGSKKEQVVEVIPQTEILVASKPIEVGQLLSAQNIKWRKWPEDSVFPGTVQRSGKDQKVLDALSGRVIRPIAEGEPILKTALVKDDGGFMAAMLKPGMRAAAIKVNAETMAGGFINPGDFVDIILTYRTGVKYNSDDPAVEARIKRIIDSNIDQYASETILQNVKVIGTDQKAVKKSEDTAGKVAKTVTLEVTQHQGEILALATQMGDLSLALRSLGDTTIIDPAAEKTISDARLSRIYKEIVKEVEKEEQSSGARRYNVRIYSGGEVTSVPVR